MRKKHKKTKKKKFHPFTRQELSECLNVKEDVIKGETDTEIISITPSQLSRLVHSRMQKQGDHASPPSFGGLGLDDKVFLVVRKVDKMASGGSGSGSGNLGSLSVSQQDRGKNKRKIDDHPPQNPLNHHSSLSEFPPYEFSPQNIRHFEAGAGSSQSDDDWDDPLARQLEELLLSTIRTIYQNAITLLVRRGYSDDVAQKAISRLGFYHGGTDVVENVVNDAVCFLENVKANPRDIEFENLQQMVEYTMLELVNVLREVKPSLSSGEAMWWLLICDMNISQACQMEDFLLGEFSGKSKEISGQSSSDSPKLRLKSQSSGLSLNTKKPNIANSSLPRDQSTMPNSSNLKSPLTPPEKESMLSIPGSSEKSPSAHPTSQTFSFEENLKLGSKSFSKKELETLQKALNAEKALRDHGKSVSQSGKITGLGGVNLEKRMKSPSKSHGVLTKGSASKLKGKVEAPTISGSIQVSGNSASVVSASDDSSKVQTKKLMSVSAAETTEHVVSEKKPMSKLENSTTVFPKISEYCAGIPYDESSGKYIPRDEKDALILKLLHEVQALQDDAQGWTNWANQKVMQAARRLGKDKLELKTLKQEKEEAEQFKKEKTHLEENELKRLLEMESALSKATSQVEAANSTIQNLEMERFLLKKGMENQKLKALETAVNCQEAFDREVKALKDIQVMNREKRTLEDELKTHKQKVVELQKEKSKEEKVQNQLEGRWNQEKALKEAMLAQFASIKYEREKAEAARKAQEDMMRQRAKVDAKKYKEEIEKLEKQVAEMRLKSEASRIAALKRSMDGNNDGGLAMKSGKQEDASNKGLKRERECVMCLSEEKTVVFLPCAHQVLCPSCNDLHRKQGMKECPSCRTPIQLRLPARFARN